MSFLGTLFVDPPLTANEHAAVLAIEDELRLTIAADGATIQLDPTFDSWDAHTGFTRLVEHLAGSGRFLYLNGWSPDIDEGEDWFAVGGEGLVRGFEEHRMPQVVKPWLARWSPKVRPDHVAGRDLAAFQRLTFDVLRVAARLGGPLDEVAASFEALVEKIGDVEHATALRHELEWIALNDIELGSDPNRLPYRRHWGCLGGAVVHLALARIATLDRKWSIDIQRFSADTKAELVQPFAALVELASACAGSEAARFMLDCLIIANDEGTTLLDDVDDNVLWTVLEFGLDDGAPGHQMQLALGTDVITRALPRLVHVAGSNADMIAMLDYMAHVGRTEEPALFAAAVANSATIAAMADRGALY